MLHQSCFMSHVLVYDRIIDSKFREDINWLSAKARDSSVVADSAVRDTDKGSGAPLLLKPVIPFSIVIKTQCSADLVPNYKCSADLAPKKVWQNL